MLLHLYTCKLMYEGTLCEYSWHHQVGATTQHVTTLQFTVGSVHVTTGDDSPNGTVRFLCSNVDIILKSTGTVRSCPPRPVSGKALRCSQKVTIAGMQVTSCGCAGGMDRLWHTTMIMV